MKNIIRFSILILLFNGLIGCFSKESKETESRIQVVGLNTFFQLQPVESRFYAGDYFLYPEELDSIIFPEGLVVDSLADSFRITGTLKWGMDNIRCLTNGEYFDIPVRKSRKQTFLFRFKDPGHEYNNITMSGSMNGWVSNKDSLKFQNGEWTKAFYLNPGDYYYHLFIDGKEMLDPQNESKADNNMGGWNSVFTVEKQTNLPPKISLNKPEGDKFYIDQNSSAQKILAYWQNHLLEIHFDREKIFFELPEEARQMEFSFVRIYAANKNEWSDDLMVPLRNGRVVFDADDLSMHDKHRMVMYFLMVDRFFNGNKSNDRKVDDPEILPKANYMGGDIAGIIQKLDTGYFDSLGVNTIWLSPIVKNPEGAWGYWNKGVTSKFSGYHGYWPVSSSEIDDRFGDAVQLRQLISKAHEKGFQILLDYVANHVHQEHPLYQQHPDWFTPLYLPDGTMNTEKWDEHRLTTWFDTFLATLDLENPVVADVMSDSAVYWFKSYQIDGFRHDATKHIPNIFWRKLNHKLKEQVMVPEGRSIFQIGETYGNGDLISSYISSGMLDAQFDFNVYDAALGFFAKPHESNENLVRVLNGSLQYYGSHHFMGNMSGNQDKPRFTSLADGSVRFDEDTKLAGWMRDIENQGKEGFNRMLLFHVFNLSIPGIPVVYYGDEIGMPGGNDPDNRRMMQFSGLDSNQTNIRSRVSEMIRFRTSNLPLIYGSTEYLAIGPDVLAIIRYYFDNTTIVLINKGNKSKQVVFQLPEFVNTQALGSDSGFNLSEREIRCTIPPLDFQIINN
jgi:cyclomaltodextrinase / maltogenic alpha-amylase / neopullulanase